MHSQFILIVTFAFIGCALSAAVDSAPKNLNASPLDASPERKNDLLFSAEEARAQLEAEVGESGDLDSSSTHHRSARLSFVGGHGPRYGYPILYIDPIYPKYNTYPIYRGYYPRYHGHHGGWHRRYYY